MADPEIKLAIKDVLLVISGAIIGYLLSNLPLYLFAITIIPIVIFLLLIITEISDYPLWKLYNQQFIFKSENDAEKAWEKIENNIYLILIDFIKNYKRSLLHSITLGNFSFDKTIIVASYNSNLITELTKNIRKIVKPRKIENLNSFSALKHIFRIDKRPWYIIASEPGTLNFFAIRRRHFSLTATQDKIQEIFNILTSKLKALQDFKISKIKDGYVFSRQKQFVSTNINCMLFGSDIIIDVVYIESESVESYGYEPLELVKIDRNVEEKINEIIKKLKKDETEYKIKKFNARAWESKVEDKKIISLKI